ncbi:MAG: hypothetical protein ACOZB0_12050 [Pseudomonadota bacterium]
MSFAFHRTFTITLGALACFPVAALSAESGVLGTPVDGSLVSGVSVISGYHCTSNNIEVLIDGASIGKAGAGTTLPSTAAICGHDKTGYSLLYNWNNLAPGNHTVSVYADGTLLGSHHITTLRSGGTAWLSGANRSFDLPNFPSAGKTAKVEWVQSVQNFMVTQITEGSRLDASVMAGTYSQGYMDAFSGTCSGSTITSTTFTVTQSGAGIKINANFGSLACTYQLVPTSGNSTDGFHMTGYQTCSNGGRSISSTASSLRRVSNKLSGSIMDDWGNGCTETLTFM